MENLAAEIGNRIKTKRVALKIKQNELANKVGISPAAINKFEKGDKKPSTNVLIKIANALNTSTDYLLLGEKDEEVSIAFRGFNKLNSSDKEIVTNLLKSLQGKTKGKK